MNPESWDDLHIENDLDESIENEVRTCSAQENADAGAEDSQMERCGGGRYYLSNTTREYDNNIQRQPDYKNFFVKQKGKEKEEVSTIRVAKIEIGGFLDKMASMFLIDKNSIVFTYPVKMTNGSEMSVKVQRSENLLEALENFYCQTEQLSMLEVSVVNVVKKPPRKIKKSEGNFKLFCRQHSATRRAYEILCQNLLFVDVFISRLSFTRVLLDDVEAVNLLNPAYFLCPVKTCKQLMKLKSFNHMQLVTGHLIQHKLQGSPFHNISEENRASQEWKLV